MALTSQDTLHMMIVLTLAATEDGEMTRAEVLDAIDQTWSARWSAEDLAPPRTRPHESNWRNRASYERARMIRHGLLEKRADGIWSLTDAGLNEAEGMIRPEDEVRDFHRRMGEYHAR